jgi:glutamyl-Q tRNA(Asp) synthetase
MEDLDPPREIPGAAEQILASLQAHALNWDDDVLWQSERHDAYARACESLLERGMAFRCDCSRAQLRAQGNVYHGRCRNRDLPQGQPASVRVRVRDDAIIGIEDRIQPTLQQDLSREVGDFIIHRKDGLHAYQLAVVIDDAFQSVTQVVRGSDLYDSSPRQVYLQGLLGLATPAYAHIPVITNAEGNKLSKQTHAEPLDDSRAMDNLRLALRFLGQPPPSDSCRSTEQLLQEAVDRWDIASISPASAIPESTLY